METVKFETAYYIKLGKKGGWAQDSIEKGIVKIGWEKVSLDDINKGNWDNIKKIIKQSYDDDGKKNGATQDYKALKHFCDATEKDIFITFHNELMYWCNLNNTQVKEDPDSKYKYRSTKNGWSNKPIIDSDKIFYSNAISGEISKTRGFQATLCPLKARAVEILNRLISGLPNPNVSKIRVKKVEICELITELVKELHWKDCEILADLIFQQSGWHRCSMHGGSMEFMDMEYHDIINNERYIVQVKSGASLNDFQEYENKFIKFKGDFKKLFFVVFHPEERLVDYLNKRKRNDVEILYGKKLSELIFDLGLLNWIVEKSF